MNEYQFASKKRKGDEDPWTEGAVSAETKPRQDGIGGSGHTWGARSAGGRAVHSEPGARLRTHILPHEARCYQPCVQPRNHLHLKPSQVLRATKEEIDKSDFIKLNVSVL